MSGKATRSGVHNAFTSNPNDAFNLFKFAADNSNVEWGLTGFMQGGKEIFSIRTSNSTEYVRTVYFQYKEINMTFTLHSHPSGGTNTREASGYNKYIYRGDMATIASRYNKFIDAGKKYPEDFPGHYIYHKESQNLYQYTPWNPSILVTKVQTGAELKNNIKNKR